MNMSRIIVIAAAFLILIGASIPTAAQTRPAASPTPSRPVAPQTTPARPAVTQPAPVAAPANVPAAKIALVDTTVFGDEKAGIKRYLAAVTTVQKGFEGKSTELRNLQSQIKAIADDITKISANPAIVSPESMRAKQAEGERLQREFKYKKEQADADFDRRYSEVVGPVSNDIGNALIQYAAQNGITMILDISKLMPAVLTVNPAMDVTQAFIADYNSKHP
jgi:Skp family chaperone for outer membrane proteins